MKRGAGRRREGEKITGGLEGPTMVGAAAIAALISAGPAATPVTEP